VSEPDRGDRRGAAHPPGTLAAVAVLILVPIVALMWVGSYARAEPRLWGFPFFYWYQFLWVFLASGCTWLAFQLLARARGGSDR
jgi:membrane protein implicated in regulation of membrane protease activity